MKKYIALSALVVLFSCAKENLDPLIFEGIYNTNGLLDFSCALLPESQMPTLRITKKSDNQYRLNLKRFSPQEIEFTFNDVSLDPGEEKDLLMYKGKQIGSWRKSPFNEDKKLVSISYQEDNEVYYFVGEKR